MKLSGERIAVVGSGVSGLATAWLLQYNGARVTLYESQATCGGHTLTDQTTKWPVDLGFQVYNLTTYPHLVAWLEHLLVDTEPSDMSFALSIDAGKLEWASHGLASVFAQRKNLFDWQFLRMVWEVLRFGRQAPEVLKPANAHKFRTVSLGQYLKERKYSAFFADNYVVPMCAAVWSVPGAQVLDFPVQMLVRFWVNHHLLDVVQRPLWRVIKGRSQAYVAAAVAGLPDVRTSTPVRSVTVQPQPTGRPKVQVVTEGGAAEAYDRVVLATHSDVSRRLRGADASPEEAAVLDAVPYSDNAIYLHSDTGLMPRTRACWASWNFIGASGGDRNSAPVCVSYWLNLLQHLPPCAPDMFVTLNPPRPPAADRTYRRLDLAHPVFSFQSWRAQERLPGVQGAGGGCVYYAGAWTDYGFHEDGMRSAVAVVDAMGATLPWVPRPTNPKSCLLQTYLAGRVVRYVRAAVSKGTLRLVHPSGAEDAAGLAHDAAPYAVVPAYPVPQPAAMGSVATAARSVLAKADGLQHDAHMAVGPAAAAMHTRVRVLSATAYARVVRHGSAGLLRAYAAREVEVSDVAAFAAVLVANAGGLVAHAGALGGLHWFGMKALFGDHLARGSSIDTAYVAVERLFDQSGTALHRLFLDEALHFGPALHRPGQASLEEAHTAFDQHVLAAAGVKAGGSVLEIGAGWGALALHGAGQGHRWLATVLSKQQFEHVHTAADARKLGHLLTLRFADWRELPAVLPPDRRFDAVLCVDPAVVCGIPRQALRAFFVLHAARLAPGGTFALLSLTIRDDLVASERHSSHFGKEAVLLGMDLLTRGEVRAAAEGAHLAAAEREAGSGGAPEPRLAAHFAATLRQWRCRLEASWHTARQGGTSDSDLRRYELSLALMEAALEQGLLQCELLTWTKEGEKASPGDAELELETARSRMQAHMATAKPVSTELLLWLQCMVLMVVGMVINLLLGGHTA